MLAGAAVVGAATWLITGLPVLGLMFAAAVPGVPWLLAAGAAERRAIDRVEAVGEWTRRLRDIAGTGAGLQAAIVASAIRRSRRRSPTRCASSLLDYRPGWNGRDALVAFADEIDDAVVRPGRRSACCCTSRIAATLSGRAVLHRRRPPPRRSACARRPTPNAPRPGSPFGS